MATQLVPLPEVERLSTSVIRILAGNPGKVSPTSLAYLAVETDGKRRGSSHYKVCRPQIAEYPLTNISRNKHILSRLRSSTPLNRHRRRPPPLGHTTPIRPQRRECCCPRSITDALASRPYQWRTGFTKNLSTGYGLQTSA